MQLLNGLAWTSQKPSASSEKTIRKIAVATQARSFAPTSAWFTTTKHISQCLILKRAKLKEEDAASNKRVHQGATGRLFSMLLCTIVSELCWLDLLCWQCYAVTFFVMQSVTIKSDIFLTLSALPLCFVFFWACTHTQNKSAYATDWLWWNMRI